ncbi:MAG: universal stress protein [Thiobacillus sp.]|nr:universal stress protein [Thiobacillus sp.]
MFKRILVAVDGSQTGELALQTAIRLATGLQAQLRIVHAADIANTTRMPSLQSGPGWRKTSSKMGRTSCPVRKRSRRPPASLPKRRSSRSTR